MQYGLNLLNFGDTADPRILADLAREAENAGWDGFFIWDHLSLPWPVPVVDVGVALAAIALATSRIRFGAQVTPLPRRHPVRYAREMATLDQLSEGRLIAGVGIGNDEEMASRGEPADPKTRAAMLDEGLELVAALWRGGPVSHEGRHYKITNQQNLPTPVQQPRIPIWTAAMWPNRAPLRRAARWDGAIPALRDGAPNELMLVDDLKMIVDIIHQGRTTSQPLDVVMMGVTPGDDPARAAEIVAPYAAAGATWWEEWINSLRFEPGDSRPALDAMRERIRQGPPRISA
jgi:alkanesulfonate monooxygenase SsuD/methylene tetrahydromethanopterin reductase-like flavin-dependent oxidoreductase (luciferase family)